MKIDVLYQFNENYAPFAGVSITSLFENNKEFDNIRVFILGEQLSTESINKFQETSTRYNRTIIFIETKKLVNKMKKLGMPTYRSSYAANMRLFLSDVVPEDVDKLLYLDADTVINGSLKELMNRDMENYALGMVLDSLADNHKREIGLDKKDKYYNSGVIIFHMKEWNNRKLSEQIVEHIKNVRSHYPSPDQDLLNVVCKDYIKMLPPEFNLQPIHLAFKLKNYYLYYRNKDYYKFEEIKKAIEKKTICHFFRFIGEFPWHENNLHPCTHMFDYYLKISEWNGYIKNKSEMGSLTKLERKLYFILPQCIFIGIFKVSHRFFIYVANKKSIKKKILEQM